MKRILVIGAGLSSSYLIRYLIENAASSNWHVCVADSNARLALSKIAKVKKNKDSNYASAIGFDVANTKQRETEIRKADIVVSLLPPVLHIRVARDCITIGKHLVTASYMGEDMRRLHKKAEAAKVLLLNECGLDPGIDHLSAMQLIHAIQKKGAEILSFKSHCGGLVAPEYDNNPWNYKFTWNPRNVVLAGQATAQYLENGRIKFIPPNRIFEQTEGINIKRLGKFESYANRDSLSYIKPYGIESAQTVLRGTLRRSGFSKAWNQLVKLGLTDDSYLVHNAQKLSYRDLLISLVPGADNKNLEKKLCAFLSITTHSTVFKKLKWLGLLNTEKLMLNEASPAQLLQALLTEKWKLQPGELDMIVMKHEIEYRLKGKLHRLRSSLVVKGEDETYTAMAKTVGLPLGIAVKLILEGKIKARGVQIPLSAEFYEPMLKELRHYGIRFTEN